MKYSELVELYEYLEGTPSRLDKTKKIAEFLKSARDEDLKEIILLIQGRVFPAYSEKEIGVADKMMTKVIASSTGNSENHVTREFRNTGDLGLSVKKLIESKRQRTLADRELRVKEVFEALKKLASVEGKGSQETKASLIKGLISHAKPDEAKYIVRTVLGQLRIGVAKGILRDSIASAFFEGSEGDERKKVVKAIEWAWFLRADYAEVAEIAKNQGMEGLSRVSIKLGKPYHVLLAEKAKNLEEALDKFENPSVEFKYDGARVCIHKKGDSLWFFTRRLENVTKQFPDLVELAKRGINADKCVIEGEMLATDPETGKPMPFQMLSQRIKRKYDIEKMAKKIPVQVNLFDMVYLEDSEMFSIKLAQRRKDLEKIIRPVKGKFQLAEMLVTKDVKKAGKFYQRALDSGQEGVIVKNLEAEYQPGRRVGYWLKVKPIMETLDLVITGAEWGTGKRASWLGSFVLSCRDGDGFKECGMMGTGIKEKGEGITFKDLTKKIKPLIEEEEGKKVKIKPEIIVEVAYEEIQKSPNYASGYALRFPRLLQLRPDKSTDEVDDVRRINKLYNQQRGREG